MRERFITKRSAVWIIPYVVSWVVHITWYVWASWIARTVFPFLNAWIVPFVVFGVWGVLVVLSHGCPFFYLHQWLEMRAGWRRRNTYGFERSTFYRLFVRPFKQSPKRRSTTPSHEGTTADEETKSSEAVFSHLNPYKYQHLL